MRGGLVPRGSLIEFDPALSQALAVGSPGTGLGGVAARAVAPQTHSCELSFVSRERPRSLHALVTPGVVVEV